MGGKITHDTCILTACPGHLDAIEIDASGIPDLVPVLAVAASTANGTTRIYKAGRLRIKESDRLAAMQDCLTRVGADITETDDGLIIRGVPALKGGTVDGYNDHRIVMAMTIASIISNGTIIIEGAGAVNKSYPAFFEDFKALGGKFRVL
jgi:3-phosphoshikimate 1-carboxyvinyltransferase